MVATPTTTSHETLTALPFFGSAGTTKGRVFATIGSGATQPAGTTTNDTSLRHHPPRHPTVTPAQLRVRDQAEKLLAFKPGVPAAIVADCQLAPEVKEWLPRPPVIIGVATQAGSLVLEVDADEYSGTDLAQLVLKYGGKEP